MAQRGSRFKRLSVDAVAEILADFESKQSDFTANCKFSLHTRKYFEDFHSKKDYA
jgi:hypothetical protein